MADTVCDPQSVSLSYSLCSSSEVAEHCINGDNGEMGNSTPAQIETP